MIVLPMMISLVQQILQRQLWGEFMINGGGNTAIINITETTAAQFEDTETIIVYDSIDAYLDIDEDGYGDINSPC